MAGEKLTGNTETRLRDLINVLKQSPFKHDGEIPASYTSILYEVNENLTTMAYYAEDWRKSNAIKKKTKASSMRHKLQQITQSIINLTKLLETVTQMPAQQYFQSIDENDEKFEQLDSMVSSIDLRRSIKGNRETQAIMETLANFEEKLKEFKQKQERNHFLESEEREPEQIKQEMVR